MTGPGPTEQYLAAARGLIDVEEDERSGGVIIRGFK